MLLDQLARNAARGRRYLERYVNDGSPSGFSDLNRTSTLTDPFNLNPWFHLWRCQAPVQFFRSFGITEGTVWDYCEDDCVLLHPDMSALPHLQRDDICISMADSFRVAPTASSRTLQIVSRRSTDYLKHHYDGDVGRVGRSLPYQKAVAGIEISQDLHNAVADGRLPRSFAFLPESGMRCLEFPDAVDKAGIGMIWREDRLIGQQVSECAHVWPLFSLFSTDRLSRMDDPILVQLIDRSGKEPRQFLMDFLLNPLLEFNFSLISRLGYQVECNAQNIMVGLDCDLQVVAIVLRDLMRCEKDLPIRRQLGLPDTFLSAPYKCIDEDNDIYRIRHSFAFDFKFAHYLVVPLVDVVSQYYGIDRAALLAEVREHATTYLASLPDDYFPLDGLWYKHERILLTHERPYVSLPDPLLR